MHHVVALFQAEFSLSPPFLFLSICTPTQKLKYPKQIGFIISNEFCERFNYYGMRSE